KLPAVDTNCCRNRDRSRAAATSNPRFTHRQTARFAHSYFPWTSASMLHPTWRAAWSSAPATATPDLEGLFLAARRQWILCRQRKMVGRLAILRLQHVVVRRPLALVISDDGIWPSEEPHCRFQRHDPRRADRFSRFPLCRPAYADRQHMEATWIVG